MSDNTQLDLGVGGDLISTDDLGGGVKVQRVKIQYGVDGSAIDVSDSNPLPIDDAGGSITVDGTVTVQDGGGSITVDGSVSLAAAIPAGTNNIGDVDILSVPAPLNVVGSGTQAAALRTTLATDSPLVSSLTTEDAVSASDPVGLPLIARARLSPLANEVAAADYVAVNASRRGELQTTVPNRSGTAQFTSTGSIDIETDGMGVMNLTIGGSFVATVVFEAFVHNGSNASTLRAINKSTGATETGASAAGEWVIPVQGYAIVRVRVSAYTSGTVFLDAEASRASTAVQVWDGGGSVTVDSPTSHDAAAASVNPLLVGAYASSAAPAAVSADTDAVRIWADRLGALQVRLRDGSGDSCMDDGNNSLRVSIVSGAGSGGTAMTDDAAFTAGVTSITPVGGYYLAARDTVNDGDAGALAMTERRALYATLETPGGDSVMDETNNAVQVRLVATDVASGGFAMADDAAFTPGTTNVNPVAGIYRSARDLVDDNDVGAVAMTQRRGLLVVLESPGGDSLVDDTSDTVKVGGGVATDASVSNLAPVLAGARAADSRLGAVSADGDAVPLRTNRHGELYTHIITPNGDSCVDDTADAVKVSVVNGASGGTAMADDGVFTVGTTAVTPAAGIYRSIRDAVNDGDAGALAMTETRALLVSLETAAGTEIGTSISPLRIDPTGTTLQPVSWGDGNITDSVTAADDTAMLSSVNGPGIVNFDITGTWSATLEFEATLNLTDYFSITAYPLGSASGVTSTTANGRWYAHNQGFQRVRVRASAYTSGTAVVKICSSSSNWVSPTSTGGGTQYAEDAAHASGDTGTLALVVRRDTAAVGSGTDGDYSTLSVNASGRLYTSTTIDAALPAGTNNIGDVDVLSLPAIPAGNNNIGDVDVASIAAGDNNIGNVDIVTMPGTVVEDAASAGGETSVLIAAVRRDTAASGVGADGDFANIGVSSAGRVWVSATIDAAIPAGNNNIGDVDVASLPALPAGTNNIGDVDVLTLPGIAGTAAHDAAVSGNPVLVAGYAETPDDSAPGNQVSAEGDATRLTLDRDGALYTHPHPPRIWHAANEYTTQQTDTSVKAAPGAGLSLYITDITINCNGAVTVTLEEGTTTIKFRYYGSAAGDGTNKQFIVPLKLAANTALTVTTSGAVTCFVGVNGYTAP